MESRITKLTVAAVIIVASTIAFHMFIADGTSNAFGQMTQNIKKMPWMHAVIEGIYSGKKDRLEAWLSFESQIYTDKRDNGKITYRQKRTIYMYEPDSDAITISYISDDTLDSMGSVWDFWKSIMEMVNLAEGKIIEDSCQFGGKDAKVYKIKIPSSPLGTPMELQIIENIETNLPVYLNQKAFGPDGQVTIEAKGYFDYPKKGPANIYEMGVPKTAKIINELPTESVARMMQEYESHRESAPSTYIAVVTHSTFFEKIDEFIVNAASVIYRNGKELRVEGYRLPRNGVLAKQWREKEGWYNIKNQMGDTFQSQFKWWKENGEIISIDLFDGKFQYEVRLENQNWVHEPKRYSPTGDDFRADNDLADFGWGVHFLSPYTGSTPFSIIETEYSKEHNLICLETTTQGRTESDAKQQIWAVPPLRIRSYINPQRDYICQRYEHEESFEASWQKDNTWFEQMDNNDIKRQTPYNKVREVIEFGQAEDGKWYPKKIQEWYPETIKSFNPTDVDIKRKIQFNTIYLEINPDFPEGIFDPIELPG